MFPLRRIRQNVHVAFKINVIFNKYLIFLWESDDGARKRTSASLLT